MQNDILQPQWWCNDHLTPLSTDILGLHVVIFFLDKNDTILSKLQVVRALKFLQNGRDSFVKKWEAVSILRGTLQVWIVFEFPLSMVLFFFLFPFSFCSIVYLMYIELYSLKWRLKAFWLITIRECSLCFVWVEWKAAMVRDVIYICCFSLLWISCPPLIVWQLESNSSLIFSQ